VDEIVTRWSLTNLSFRADVLQFFFQQKNIRILIHVRIVVLMIINLLELITYKFLGHTNPDRFEDDMKYN